MVKGVLRVEYIRPGNFSDERVVKITDFKGKDYEGLFQKGHMQGDSRLVVNILQEKGEDMLIGVPHGEHCGLYGHGLDAYGFVTIKKRDLAA